MKKRLDAYKKKLLDTGRRNKLINFKKSYVSTVEVLTDDIYKLYKDYMSGLVFNFAKLFEDLDDFIDLEEEDVKDRLANALGKTVYYKQRYSKEEIDDIKKRFKPVKGKNYLFSSSITNLLNRILLLLKKKSQLFYEENGVNSLYLCFGFLKYQEDKQEYLAPLVLVPSVLSQKTIKDDFKIKAIDDDYNVNENLIHKFKTEYKIDLTPTDPDMSLKEYLSFVGASVSKLGFTVLEDVWLGLFSFSKIIMYRDIVDNEELIKNSEIIKAFCDAPSNLNKDITLSDVDLDNCEKIAEQNQVLYADSSQYKSIYFAKEGLSFVLQGPPGTGKSQTITNILAELIGKDKKVLFVCEKKSALEVVYRNLKKRKLDMYALPMFDTNANKKEIVKGIYENLVSIQDNRETMSKKALNILETVEESKGKLETYFKEVTKLISPINMSLYQIASILEENNSYPLLEFKMNNILDVKEEEYKSFINSIELFSDIIKKLGDDPTSHPFYLFNKAKLSMMEENTFKKLVLSQVGKLDDLMKFLKSVRDNLKIEVMSFDHVDKIISFLNSATNLKDVPAHYLNYTNLDEVYQKLTKIIALENDNSKIKKDLLSKYKASFLDLDSDKLINEMEEKYDTKIKRLFGYKKLDSYLEEFLLVKKNLKYDEEIEDLKKLSRFKENFYEIASLDTLFKEKFSEYYFGTLTNFNDFKQLIKNLSNIEEGYKYISSPLSKEDLIAHLTCDEARGYFKSNANKLDELLTRSKESLLKLNNYFDYDLTKENPLVISKRLKVASLEFDRVNEYIDFINAYKKLDDKLKDFKKEVLAKRLKSEDILPTFKKRFAVLYIDEYLLNNSSMDIFSNTYLNKLIDKYQQNDDKLLDVSKVKIKENVTSSWPQLDSLMANNLEVKTLVVEANKKRKLKSLRVLFKEIPNVLMDLKPIFMMSPQAVSTFLDPNLFHFDCVVFDEASQITAENAIGAMYRASQVIIVGDNEQLPPTSFFDSTENDEEDDEYDIYESILDQAIVTLPKIMLKWHYRSKDESLIAFSNKEIYHDLTSFPSDEKSNQLGVLCEYVSDAIYVQGKRINQKEALRVVDVLVDIIKTNPEKSCGVVTFNMAQQVYIERLINKKRIEDPSIEEYFSDEKAESFFVKNLETVQGDERDIIILSTTFGPNETGKFSMNFGPINKEGGYRRLNVAITRAKESVILVTSMKPSDFRLTETTNRGVTMLHDYIKYAQEAKNTVFKGQKSEDGIVSSVCDFLDSKGYKYVTNLGCSGYKIDIAVINPKNENEFILAILSDGVNYQKLKTVRDRNHLMDEVLRQRGWNIYHIWSISYIRNKTSVLNEILNKLTVKTVENYNESNILVDLTEKTTKEDVHTEELFDLYPDILSIVGKYKNDTRNKAVIIDDILNQICPIHIDEFKKIILPLFDKSRLSQALSNDLDDIINDLISRNKYYKVIGFLLTPSNLYGVNFRRYNKDLYYPSIEHIYIEELEDGLIKIISEIKTTSRKILYQAFNELVGYAKGSSLTKNTIDNVLNVLSDKGRISLSDEIVEFIE